ncbi:hypothetical protein DSO57_1037458 [Entomophthora muscae]|uniref:Uncharacterized protein n=1 Tax=Entomophthora muscae TaxID=34485 RepID=A0ACC2SBR4_9FUNG|nr:hypothetical protein DSO57_1037458 [Entomophthora muscae]
MKFSLVFSGLVLACVPVVRREIRELSSQELRKLTNAINQLHKQGKYEEFTKIHLDNTAFAHEMPEFLPWHRYFIRKFEMALQEIDPSVSLPYWDWSLDSQAPHLSKVLTPSMYGGNGKKDKCVQDGPFANWQMTVPDKHCLRRDFDRGANIQPFGYPEEINLFLNEPRFSDFSRLLEDKHAYPHLFIGGDRGDLNPMWSPNDPIFYLHHTFMDLLWSKWQERHPNSDPYEGKRYNLKRTPKDKFTPWKNITVESTFDIKNSFYCYTYPEYPRPVFAASATEEHKIEVKKSINTNPFLNGFLKNTTIIPALDLLREKVAASLKTKAIVKSNHELRVAGPFTDKWIKSFEFNLKEFRMNSDNSILLAQLLNQLEGFESLASFRKYFN